MAWEYSEKTKEIFMDAVHGKPGTHMGRSNTQTGSGSTAPSRAAMHSDSRSACAASNRSLQDVITEARYLTFGCTSAIASSEALCTLIEQGGYTPVGALKITNRDIVTYLGGLPDQKIHCSVMGAEALERPCSTGPEAWGGSFGSRHRHARRGERGGPVVCQCFGLTEPYIKRKIRELGLKTIAEITGAIKAGGACMSCHHKPGGLQDLLAEVWGPQPLTLKVLPTQPTPREPVAVDRATLSRTSSARRWRRLSTRTSGRC